MGKQGASENDAKHVRALMLKVRAGDVHAFQELYERFKGPLMSYVHSFIQDPPIAEDLVQEVFLRVYRNRASYEPQAQVSTWLWTIARNACIDQLRKASNREKVVAVTEKDDDGGGLAPFDLEQIEAPLPDAEALLIENAEAGRLERCMEKLAAHQREALLLRTVSELPYEEIAVTVGVSLSAVKSLLFRAKEALTKCLGKEADDGG
jgi:RNA polymerase sigma-70 factor (ECF subfamily)